MTTPGLALADRELRSPACAPAIERTVYLRRQAQGWIVSLDEVLLLATRDEEQAFQRACEARLVEGEEPLRLLILSAPSAAACGGAGVALDGVQAEVTPTSTCAAIRQNRDGNTSDGNTSPGRSPEARAAVAA